MLPWLVFLAAVLYSTVGHAGASGYLAAMAFVGVPPEQMRPTSLTLNILVATIATIRFARAGCFDWRLLLPFAIGSVPLAFLGGTLTLSSVVFKRLIGLVLLLSAGRLLYDPVPFEGIPQRPPHPLLGVFVGAAVGLLSGLTGTGGGIFLTPIMIFLNWADVRRAAGVSAAFILVNSLAGLAGLLSKSAPLPDGLGYLLLAAGIGGVIGSELGSRRLGSKWLRRVLACVLLVAAYKMFAT